MLFQDVLNTIAYNDFNQQQIDQCQNCSFNLTGNIYFKSQMSNFFTSDNNKTFKLSKCTVITIVSLTLWLAGHKRRVWVEEHKQWYDYRWIFLTSCFVRPLVYRTAPAHPPDLQATILPFRGEKLFPSCLPEGLISATFSSLAKEPNSNWLLGL